MRNRILYKILFLLVCFYDKMHLTKQKLSFTLYRNNVSDNLQKHKKTMRKTTVFPIPVSRTLKKLGSDIKEARIRRRITAEMMVQRAGITRPTLAKVERGDPMTSMGIYAKVLFVLGLSDKLEDIADIRFDTTGLILDAVKLPKRSRALKEHN